MSPKKSLNQNQIQGQSPSLSQTSGGSLGHKLTDMMHNVTKIEKELKSMKKDLQKLPSVSKTAKKKSSSQAQQKKDKKATSSAKPIKKAKNTKLTEQDLEIISKMDLPSFHSTLDVCTPEDLIRIIKALKNQYLREVSSYVKNANSLAKKHMELLKIKKNQQKLEKHSKFFH